MRALHTGDWHVGKKIRGRTRADEHRCVLREITDIVGRERVDLVLVAGDLFDTAAPSPESQGIVYDALLDFAATGAEVAVVTGNHDNAHVWRVLGPLFARAGVRVLSEVTRPEAGGVTSFTAGDGTRVNLAMLPFVSKRGIVRADQLMNGAAFDNALIYAQRMTLLITALCSSFQPDAVNILMAHAFVLGGAAGGGERAAHLVEEYALQAPSFPATASYVALGHLHRPQAIAGATAIHYCGAPLQLDFGEADQVKQVNLVDLSPGVPARVTPIGLTSGRPLRAYRGTMDQLRMTVDDDDAWLRLTVVEQQRAGLGDEVRQLFGERVVDVRIESVATSTPTSGVRHGRSPHELLADYLAAQGIDDPRVNELFADLLDADSESGRV